MKKMVFLSDDSIKERETTLTHGTSETLQAGRHFFDESRPYCDNPFGSRGNACPESSEPT
jgi:hypothetical protein